MLLMLYAWEIFEAMCFLKFFIMLSLYLRSSMIQKLWWIAFFKENRLEILVSLVPLNNRLCDFWLFQKNRFLK